jgi:hypothetical protein
MQIGRPASRRVKKYSSERTIHQVITNNALKVNTQRVVVQRAVDIGRTDGRKRNADLSQVGLGLQFTLVTTLGVFGISLLDGYCRLT